VEEDTSNLRNFERRILQGDVSAVRELGSIGSSDAIALLLKVLENSRGIERRGVIQSIPVIKELEAPLIRILELGYEYESFWDAMIPTDVVMKLAAFGTQQASSAIRKWTEGLLQLDSDWRFHAMQGILSLGQMNDIESVELFRTCLHDADDSIRSAAIHAVGRVKDIESVPRLIQLLSDKSENPLASEHLVCDSVAEALSLIGDERAIQPMAQMIEKQQTGMHPNIAITALGKLGENGFAKLLNILNEADVALRSEIIYSLGLIGNKKAVPLLIHSLKDKNELVRQNASEALWHLYDERAIEPLILTLEDKNSHVQQAVIHALSRFKETKVIISLIQTLKVGNADVRCAAAEVLGWWKAEQAVPALVSLLSDNSKDFLNRPVCEVAAQALMEINTKEAVDAVHVWKTGKSKSN
jgi:HEAT repeat protein